MEISDNSTLRGVIVIAQIQAWIAQKLNLTSDREEREKITKLSDQTFQAIENAELANKALVQEISRHDPDAARALLRARVRVTGQ